MKNNNLVAVLTLFLIMIFLLAGCGREDEQQIGEQEYGQTAFSNELFFAGSSTLAPTISQIADTFRNEYRTWNRVDRSMPEQEIMISVSTGGSGAGARAVLDGTANFGMLARAAREGERSALSEYQEVIVGIDALMITVQKDNTLGQKRNDIKSSEVRQIFSGEITRWNELDPALPEEEIVLLVRDVGGGAHGVFQAAIMGEVDVSENAVQVPSMSGLVNRLVGNSRAIGYASYGVADQQRDDLVVFSLDGVEPSAANILDGSYPVSRPLVLIWNGQLSSAEQAFLDYIMSEKGMQVVAEMGFLPAK